MRPAGWRTSTAMLTTSPRGRCRQLARQLRGSARRLRGSARRRCRQLVCTDTAGAVTPRGPYGQRQEAGRGGVCACYRSGQTARRPNSSQQNGRRPPRSKQKSLQNASRRARGNDGDRSDIPGQHPGADCRVLGLPSQIPSRSTGSIELPKRVLRSS